MSDESEQSSESSVEDRPVLRLTDLDPVDEEIADALARAGYRTVWTLLQTDNDEIADDVEDRSQEKIGSIVSGIGDIDPEAYRYKLHFTPEEQPATEAIFDPVRAETVSEPPGSESTAASEHSSSSTDTEEESKSGDDHAFVVNWATDTEGSVIESDPLTRLPTILSSGIAITFAIIVSGLLAVSVGLSSAFVAALVTAGLFSLSFWALTSEYPPYVVGGSFLLIVSSIAFLGALGLSVRATAQPLRILVSIAFVFGIAAVVLDLIVGLRTAVRTQVRSSLVTISLALPVGILLALALDSPLAADVVTATLTAFTMFLQAPSAGFAPVGLLFLETGVLAIGFAMFRVRIPAPVVPAAVRPLFERNRKGVINSVGRRQAFILGLLWFPLGVFALTLGSAIVSPEGVVGYGPRVYSISTTLLRFIWDIGRNAILHWFTLCGLAALSMLALAAGFRKRVLFNPQRRSVFLSSLGFILLVTLVGIATPLVTRTIEPVLVRLAAQQAFVASIYQLYQMLGPATLLLIGSYLGVVIIAVLLYGVYLLELFRIVPDKSSGLALGSAFLVMAAALVGLLTVPPGIVFIGIAGTIYVWDVGQYATKLGMRLGRETETKRAELVHATGGFIGVGLAVVLSYGGYQITQQYNIMGSEVQLLLGLILSVGGVITLLFSLRD